MTIIRLLNISFYRRYRLQLAIISLFVVVPWALPQLPVAAAASPALEVGEVVPLVIPFLPTEPVVALHFPQAGPRLARYSIRLPVTAYSSTPDQTDSTPFITASGTRVRWGVAAANFLPIGTKVRLPDNYGDQVFVVEDRMNARYDTHLDIWMETRAEAKQWGFRHTTIEVL